MRLSSFWRMTGAVAAALIVAGCTPQRPDNDLSYPMRQAPIPEPGGPVWLIGVDGASWDLMRPLVDGGELPNFAAMMQRGSFGTLRSEDPTISPALWATIATGHPREVHGVANFTVKLPGSYKVVEAGPLDRRSPAVWDYVGTAGGRSCVVSWFGSFPAEEIAGTYLAKGTDPARVRSGQVHPVTWAEQLSRLEPIEPATRAAARIAKTPFLRDALNDDARTMRLLELAVAREPVDLVAAYFAGIDIVQHVTWKDMDPAYVPFPDERARRVELEQVIPDYYRYVDELLGRVVALAPDDATFVIVSDHGGGPMEPAEAFHYQLDVLLELLEYQRGRAGRPGEVDWSETRAFTISELYRQRKHIWLNLQGVEQEGIVPVSHAARLAEQIADHLSSLRVDSRPLFDKVHNLVANDRWQPGDPALAVRFSDDALTAGRFVDGDRSYDMNPIRLRHRDVSGGHRLDGIFIAAGPHVAAGELAEPVTLYQIAPTVMYWLGLPQSREMLSPAAEARVLIEAIGGARLREHPIEMVESYPIPPRQGRQRLEAEDARGLREDRQALQRLRGLGYIQ